MGVAGKNFSLMEGFTRFVSNNAREIAFILLEGAGRKGGAHSVSRHRAEDKDIARGEHGVKGNKETFPHNPKAMEIEFPKN